MKTLTLILLICIAWLMAACSTTGGGPFVKGGTAYLVSGQLAGAKTLDEYTARAARFSALVTAFETLETDGLTLAILRPIVVEKFATDPRKAILVELVLGFFPVDAGTGVIAPAILKDVTAGVKLALSLPPPAFKAVAQGTWYPAIPMVKAPPFEPRYGLHPSLLEIAAR